MFKVKLNVEVGGMPVQNRNYRAESEQKMRRLQAYAPHCHNLTLVDVAENVWTYEFDLCTRSEDKAREAAELNANDLAPQSMFPVTVKIVELYEHSPVSCTDPALIGDVS